MSVSSTELPRPAASGRRNPFVRARQARRSEADSRSQSPALADVVNTSSPPVEPASPASPASNQNEDSTLKSGQSVSGIEKTEPIGRSSPFGRTSPVKGSPLRRLVASPAEAASIITKVVGPTVGLPTAQVLEPSSSLSLTPASSSTSTVAVTPSPLRRFTLSGPRPLRASPLFKAQPSSPLPPLPPPTTTASGPVSVAVEPVVETVAKQTASPTITEKPLMEADTPLGEKENVGVVARNQPVPVDTVSTAAKPETPVSSTDSTGSSPTKIAENPLRPFVRSSPFGPRSPFSRRLSTASSLPSRANSIITQASPTKTEQTIVTLAGEPERTVPSPLPTPLPSPDTAFPNETAVPAPSSPTTPDSGGGGDSDDNEEEPRRINGLEVRSDAIRAATSKRLSDRSPNLPKPAFVSSQVSRPIVSFQPDWQPSTKGHEQDRAQSDVGPVGGDSAATAVAQQIARLELGTGPGLTRPARQDESPSPATRPDRPSVRSEPILSNLPWARANAVKSTSSFTLEPAKEPPLSPLLRTSTVPGLNPKSPAAETAEPGPRRSNSVTPLGPRPHPSVATGSIPSRLAQPETVLRQAHSEPEIVAKKTADAPPGILTTSRSSSRVRSGRKSVSILEPGATVARLCGEDDPEEAAVVQVSRTTARPLPSIATVLPPRPLSGAASAMPVPMVAVGVDDGDGGIAVGPQREVPTVGDNARGQWSRFERPSRSKDGWALASAPRPIARASPTTGVSALCHQCRLPISGRIVTAAGARFHPDCFGCTMCGEMLECVAFYPEPEQARAHRLEKIKEEKLLSGQMEADDEEDQILFYCHLDFHETFSPRCKSCQTPIEGEVVLACGAEYHVGHFFCAQCGDPFGPETPFVEKDGYGWCVDCHTNRFSAKCRRCRKPVTTMVIKALGGEWHADCFCCSLCEQPFPDGQFFLSPDGKEPVCVVCEQEKHKM